MFWGDQKYEWIVEEKDNLIQKKLKILQGTKGLLGLGRCYREELQAEEPILYGPFFA